MVGFAASELADETPLSHVVAVDALTEQGPDGPTLAARWLWASRLVEAAGDHVKFLGVLDIYPYLGYDDDVDDVTLFERLVQISGEDIENHERAANIAELDYDGIGALPHRPRSLLSASTSADLRRIVATMRLHAALGASFTPGIFTGDLHLVIAALESPGSEGNPSSLWSEYISGRILATRVDTLHDDLLDAGNVAEYASQLFTTLS